MKLKSILSVPEQKMFSKLGYSHLFDYDESVGIQVIPLYRMAVEKCFVEKLDGPEVEALRKSYSRITNGEYRGCIQHDRLIESELSKNV